MVGDSDDLRAQDVRPLSCNGTTLEFNATNGNVASLAFDDGEPWSRLVELRYLTFRDEGKKGMVCNKSTCPNPIPGAWAPALLSFKASDDGCRATLELGFNETLSGKYGAPSAVTTEYIIDPSSNKRVNVTVTWHNKTATRLQEGMSVFSRPEKRDGYRWEMDKLGEWTAVSNVTGGGEMYKAAVWSGIRYSSLEGGYPSLRVETLDAALVCPVLNKNAQRELDEESSLAQACFKYDIPSPRDPGLQQSLTDTMLDGMAINLHQNFFGISGFPQWFPFGVGDRYQKDDEHLQFRFAIAEEEEQQE